MKKFVLSLFITVGFFLLSISIVLANEGIVKLRSTGGQDFRCFAASIRMQDQNHRVIISCRDLIYPGGVTVFDYILWGDPTGGGDPFKLGPLGTGKAEFKTKEIFAGLFVTTEENSRTREPKGEVVMRGALELIEHLERPTTPTPTPEDAQPSEEQVAEESSTGSRLSTALKRAGIVILLALAAVVGLVFVLTRQRS